MARRTVKAEVEPVEAPVEESTTELEVGQYINNSIAAFVAAREAYVAEHPDDTEVRFLVATAEALIATSQSVALLLSDLHTRVTAVLDAQAEHTHEV